MQIPIRENIVRRNSLKAWILAARPKTLTAASVPVMIGCACAWDMLSQNASGHIGSAIELIDPGHIGSAIELIDPGFRFGTLPNGFNWLAAVLCMLFAFVMQIDANFVNDYFDCIKGKDNEERLGPERACQQGWVSLSAMRWAIGITSIIACLTGLPLVLFGGYQLILVGAACLLFCFLYTTCLAGMAMGDVLVLLFFGIVPCVFTTYVIVPPELQQWQSMPWLMGIATGLVVDTLLIVNNYRDIDNDRSVGKKTLIVFIGRKYAEWLYMAIVPAALCIVLCLYGFTSTNLIITFAVYFFHIQTSNKMRQIGQGRALNKVLGMTARNIFLYGILITLLVILR